LDVKVQQKIPITDLTDAKSNTAASSKCENCEGSKCCQYTTVSIDTPRSIRDFDNLIWHVSHINTHVFKDPDGWYLLFYTQCQHLSANGNCNIYLQRPFVCREHDNDHCEYDLDMRAGSELYFIDYDELNSYCANRFKKWHKRFEKL